MWILVDQVRAVQMEAFGSAQIAPRQQDRYYVIPGQLPHPFTPQENTRHNVGPGVSAGVWEAKGMFSGKVVYRTRLYTHLGSSTSAMINTNIVAFANDEAKKYWEKMDGLPT